MTATESQTVFLKQLVELLEARGLDGIQDFENDEAWADADIEKALALSGIPIYHPAHDVNYGEILHHVGGNSFYTAGFYWDLSQHADETEQRRGNLFDFLFGDREHLPGDAHIWSDDPLVTMQLRKQVKRERIIKGRRRVYYRLLVSVALWSMGKADVSGAPEGQQAKQPTIGEQDAALTSFLAKYERRVGSNAEMIRKALTDDPLLKAIGPDQQRRLRMRCNKKFDALWRASRLERSEPK